MLPMPCAHFADSSEPSHCGRSQCPAGRAEAAGFAEAGGKVGRAVKTFYNDPLQVVYPAALRGGELRFAQSEGRAGRCSFGNLYEGNGERNRSVHPPGSPVQSALHGRQGSDRLADCAGATGHAGYSADCTDGQNNVFGGLQPFPQIRRADDGKASQIPSFS